MRWNAMRERLYTMLVRKRFAHWGTRSRLERYAKLVSPKLVAVDDDVYICNHVWLNACDDRGDGQPTLRIGKGVYIGRFSQINAWRQVQIGSNVLIADRVFISDSTHCFRNTELPIIQQGDAYVGPVNLKEGCWIGIGAVILPGVTIGKNAVVAANAVVTHDVADFTIVGGVPARFIGKIGDGI